MRVWEHEQDKQQADKTKEKAQVGAGGGRASVRDRYGNRAARGKRDGCLCAAYVGGGAGALIGGVSAVSLQA